jgi:hypothetical protein
MKSKRFSSIPSPPFFKGKDLPSVWSKREPFLEEVSLKEKFVRFSKIYTWCSYCDDLVNRKNGFPAPDWVKRTMEKFPKSHGICNPCEERIFPRNTPPQGLRVDEDLRLERESGYIIKGRSESSFD